MIFLDRRRRETDGWLEWKVRLFLLGGALALLGMGMGSRVVVALAILILLAGVALRFLPDPEGGEDGEDGRDPQDPGGL